MSESDEPIVTTRSVHLPQSKPGSLPEILFAPLGESMPDLPDPPPAELAERPYDKPEQVDHPAHYGGDTPHEVIKCLEAWGLDADAYLFNVVKYIARPGKGDYLTDLKKARFYLDRRIRRMEGR